MPIYICKMHAEHIKFLANVHILVDMLYRTGGVIFFIDYCTAIRDTQKG